ncbi:ATP-binding cassette domain-containing protein [Thermophilibacter sp. ET337]|uniref:ATP-binding cassette domain-containing protein n=1 Tax=Thermophilibacter sp. ET337 TaxID=2973084 RepID=UPI0021ABDDC9|nr:ATP-binding cassette domain-containing protein [Thermophilibacter sp. ET337]MCR8907369.1 ATP-binding cassette domain-containing protein [Thermophilibacter sp. ET337]
MGEKIVEARGVCHAYVPGRQDLRGVSLDVAPGELVAIVGENGSGKTTLARHLNALIALQAGALSVAGLDAADPEALWELRRACGMVFQNPENQFVSSVVGEDVAFGPLNFGMSEKDARAAAAAALGAVGLPGFERRDVHALSGGQQQRVALAGVLASGPEVIVLDEATSMIDPQGRDELVRAVLRARAERGATVIWITHDMELAARADRVVVMRAGEVAAAGAPEDVLVDEALLASAGLEPPMPARVWAELVRLGAASGPAPVTVEGLVSALCA